MMAHKILLVDDDISLLKLLSIRLKSADYEVETAENAHQAPVSYTHLRAHETT